MVTVATMSETKVLVRDYFCYYMRLRGTVDPRQYDVKPHTNRKYMILADS